MIRLEVRDAATGELLPCRLAFRGERLEPVWGRDAAGQDMAYLGTPRLWCDGQWEGDVPAGARTLVISRPYEYRSQVLDLPPDDDPVIVQLERACDMSAEGWFCGDAHQHVVHGEALLQVDLPAAAAVARAEGADWMVFDSHFTSLPGAEQPTPAQLDLLCAAASSSRFLALWAEEYPKHDLGHLASFPQNTGHFHPDLAGAGIDDATCWGMWFMWLNAGLRVGLCAFNDACYDRAGGQWREPVAYRRTYAHLGDQLDSAALARAIRGGQTWGTTGPLLVFDVDGQGPGHVFDAGDPPRCARLTAWGAPLYADPAQMGSIARMILYRNGEIAKVWEYGDGAPRVAETFDLDGGISGADGQKDEDSAWYVARVEGTLPEQLAVTSPIYAPGAGYRPPRPYPAQVRASVVDASTGAPLAGRMELVEYACDRVDVVEERLFTGGVFQGAVPGDLRLRACVEGYPSQALSPILHCDAIYRDLLGGLRTADLADPAYYARLREALDRVELRFELHRE